MYSTLYGQLYGCLVVIDDCIARYTVCRTAGCTAGRTVGCTEHRTMACTMDCVASGGCIARFGCTPPPPFQTSLLLPARLGLTRITWEQSVRTIIDPVFVEFPVKNL